MNNNTLVLGLNAHTWIHAGSGEKDGVVDLPIQREAHTGWPVVFGSSLKGAMRSAATRRQKDQSLITLFGPEALGEGVGSEKHHAGALMISDARLIWLPVRSLTTHTRYVTCPAMMRRLLADMARAGQAQSLEIPTVQNLDALVCHKESDRLYLEEYAFSQQESTVLRSWCDLLARFSELDAEEVAQQLVLISNDQFSHLSQAAIPLHPHIAIDYETKSVVDGALWYEEALPPETLFYSLIMVNDARDKSGLKAETLRNQLKARMLEDHPYLQVGGNETTGMGWVKLTSLEG
ncbi:type III-B CRISPR module RAMP protein Cmr4 [uncultured Shewanella sp.]|uniref:type III-B CRISPR module RAMP protein Cmr4 n=1 Tax=uncultured Shewanella sp. TaxID=173975 RepID=UPI0026223289|nr:type III-B CRISPR module RAMP protein Cmr4 [uncultured Shewanella sp.]